jgi:hypothetical protein
VDAEYLTSTKRNTTITDILLRHTVSDLLYIIEAAAHIWLK